jgi:hypothetical protein
MGKENEGRRDSSTAVTLVVTYSRAPSSGIIGSEHKKTVLCKQRSLSSEGNESGGKRHNDVDRFTFVDRSRLLGHPFWYP